MLGLNQLPELKATSSQPKSLTKDSLTRKITPAFAIPAPSQIVPKSSLIKNEGNLNLGMGQPLRSHIPHHQMQEIIHNLDIYQYAPTEGLSSLRSSIARKYYNSSTLSSQILITHGAINAIDLILRYFLKPGDEVLISDPAFPLYKSLVEYAGGRTVFYQFTSPTDSKRPSINWDHMEKFISSHTRLIIINSPHNPTGKVMNELDQEHLVRILNKYPQVYFLLDEAYRELIFDSAKNPHRDLTKYINRGFIVGSFSKCFPMAGARVGWLLTNPTFYAPLKKLVAQTLGSASHIGQVMANFFLNSYYNALSTYQEAARFTSYLLSKHKISHSPPDGGFYMMVHCGKLNAQLVCKELEERGLIVLPGTNFGQTLLHSFRLCFAVSNDDIARGITIIARYFVEKRLI